ncbi:MAG TPA: hypothetical protein PKW63_02670 [Vicinamibacterales bacterium]|nr:hypothetical protein [Vicinamibacterales bacterium]
MDITGGVPGRLMSPSSNLPLLYFGVAHVSLALACVALVAWPGLPGPFFFHPKMVALIHLLTVGWLTGSILGAFYIVAPLALRMPFPVTRVDWILALGFGAGLAGMVLQAWAARYDAFVLYALPVGLACLWVALRAWRGLMTAVVPWPVKLHIALAFVNLIAAIGYGGIIGWDKARGTLAYSPMLLAFAHAHLAAIGFALMMVVGLSYRLIPMFLPAAMPTGASLAWSAVLIEAGLIVLVLALPGGHPAVAAGALLIVAGLVMFVRKIRGALAHRMPRPPALPARDWSTWQTHTALLWLGVAIVSGLILTMKPVSSSTIPLMWVYGTAGLVGFLTQIVVGMQGRLVPMYLWYRAWALHPGAPPAVAANALPSAAWARPLFVIWVAAVPTLTWGFASHNSAATNAGAGLLLCGVLTNAAYLLSMMRRLR